MIKTLYPITDMGACLIGNTVAVLIVVDFHNSEIENGTIRYDHYPTWKDIADNIVKYLREHNKEMPLHLRYVTVKHTNNGVVRRLPDEVYSYAAQKIMCPCAIRS